MASGTLAQSAPAATTYTTVYTVPASKVATLNINVVNRGSTTTSVRLAIAAADTPVAAEFIEYGAAIPASGVLERTGVRMSADKKLVVYASSADTSVNVYGYEE